MSSRLIVKNLPPYVTPERLRQHFQQKGAPQAVLTDAKVSMKPDGTSRRFGFVGFKTPAEAAKAQAWFDRTFIDSVKIDVKVVEEKGHEPSPRPNKRARVGPSPGEASTSRLKESTTPAEPTKKNKQLEEFMEVMQPKKGPTWANDATATAPEPIIPTAPSTSAQAPAAATPKADEDVAMEDVSEDAPAAEPLSDADWLKQRMSANVDKVKEEKVFEQSDDEDEGEAKKDVAMDVVKEVKPEEPKDPIKETILQTSRLFVRNLTFSCTEEELSEHFRPYGTISQIHIPLDLNTKQGKGLAYVTFAAPAEAVAAYESLDKRPFQGRLLHILGAVDRKGNADVEDKDGKSKTVKAEIQARRKALAGKEFNWSMLYMNSDAVASSIADRMNIPKTAILNPESGESSTNPSVKLALAETHIITETKAYLESNGVVLSSFTTKARSDTVILVKNIPYGTMEAQIRELFEPHGDLARVLVPPAGTIAVVEYVRPDEAAKGFKAVAYRRLGNSIVYVERGPLGMFTEGDVEPQTSAEDRELLEKTVIRAPKGVSTAEGEADLGGGAPGAQDGEGDVAGGSTLYVKNLSFATTQEKLVQVFSGLPSFSFARVQTKTDPKKPRARLSMGYGFVGFKDVEGARKALSSMQGFVLDGHELSVKFAGRGKEEMEKEVRATGTGSKGRTTKMIVKNVPFETTKKDIRDLFSAHGKLKSVRMPKKFDSRTRGFAFLEFVTRHEAENAFNALKHTHLLGRHLVLQWAEEEEQDLDALRKKAGVGFGDGKAMPGRKRKLDMGGKDDQDPEDLEV
ncbi:rRNA primary transcript binding protein [Ephemerocybe angulata]|uniref:rRNA primary transcript binding protein n=1 Tax=Ephemerocybe angulata TaxID=980116 RepID=A0A8H6HP92_9AGAR|nr:rRNA primary transcript binding protein [Tulosesus angulatus]